MSLYGWVLALSMAGPVVFSFYPKFGFVKKWGRALAASLIVAIPFWVWDALATSRGDWSFNSKYVGGNKIGGLPIEEILFFIVIPFCCLFIWNIIERYWKDRLIGYPKGLETGAIVLMLSAVAAVGSRYYTATLLGWSAGALLVIKLLDKKLINRANYWRWILITFIPFLIVNGVLTALPVVSYSPSAILGIRIGTIPIEDFLYSWSLLTLNLVVYRKLNKGNRVL